MDYSLQKKTQEGYQVIETFLHLITVDIDFSILTASSLILNCSHLVDKLSRQL